MAPSFWRQYGKTIISFVWAVVTVIIPLVSGDHHLNTAESVIVVLAVGNNIIVYLVPAFPRFTSAKTVVTALLAGGAVLQLAVGSGGFSALDANDWYQVVAAVLLGFGIWYAPAISNSPSGPVEVPPGLNS